MEARGPCPIDYLAIFFSSFSFIRKAYVYAYIKSIPESVFVLVESDG